MKLSEEFKGEIDVTHSTHFINSMKWRLNRYALTPHDPDKSKQLQENGWMDGLININININLTLKRVKWGTN